MYLVDSSAPPINNRKWNLGRFGRMGLSPVRLPNLGASSTRQTWRGGMGRLGQTSVPTIVYRDPGSGWSEDSGGNVYDASGILVSLNNLPSPVGRQNPSPVDAGASNGGITTVKAAQPSTNAMDYTSPQAAVAAGLDPKKVMEKWSFALAQFSSPQAAITAGIPAGVVNQLWQQGLVNKVQAARKKHARRKKSCFFGLGDDSSDPTTIDTSTIYDPGNTLISPDSGPTFNYPLLPSSAGETSFSPITGALTPPSAGSIPLTPTSSFSSIASAAAALVKAGSIGAQQLLQLQPAAASPVASAPVNLSTLLLYGGGALLLAMVLGGGRRR